MTRLLFQDFSNEIQSNSVKIIVHNKNVKQMKIVRLVKLTQKLNMNFNVQF